MKMDPQQGALGASPKFSAADGLKSLDIRTKTIELTLQPMLQQVVLFYLLSFTPWFYTLNNIMKYAIYSK